MCWSGWSWLNLHSVKLKIHFTEKLRIKSLTSGYCFYFTISASIQRSYRTSKSMLKLKVYVIKKYHLHFMGVLDKLKARTSIRHRLLHFRHCSLRTIAQAMLELTSGSQPVQAPTESRGNSVRLLRAFPSWGLNFSMDTTFSHKLYEPPFQCLTTFTVITFLLYLISISNVATFARSCPCAPLRWIWLHLHYTLTLDSWRLQAIQFSHQPHLPKAE